MNSSALLMMNDHFHSLPRLGGEDMLLPDPVWFLNSRHYYLLSYMALLNLAVIVTCNR